MRSRGQCFAGKRPCSTRPGLPAGFKAEKETSSVHPCCPSLTIPSDGLPGKQTRCAYFDRHSGSGMDVVSESLSEALQPAQGRKGQSKRDHSMRLEKAQGARRRKVSAPAASEGTSHLFKGVADQDGLFVVDDCVLLGLDQRLHERLCGLARLVENLPSLEFLRIGEAGPARGGLGAERRGSTRS